MNHKFFYKQYFVLSIILFIPPSFAYLPKNKYYYLKSILTFYSYAAEQIKPVEFYDQYGRHYVSSNIDDNTSNVVITNLKDIIDIYNRNKKGEFSHFSKKDNDTLNKASVEASRFPNNLYHYYPWIHKPRTQHTKRK